MFYTIHLNAASKKYSSKNTSMSHFVPNSLIPKTNTLHRAFTAAISNFGDQNQCSESCVGIPLNPRRYL